MRRSNHAMDMMEEVHQEEREAEKPGARGSEYRDRERVGDEGQPYRKGGGIHHKRVRGGYLPEETEASEDKRGEGNHGRINAEHEPEPDRKEGEEKYADERKKGGRVKRRKRGGVLNGKGEMDGAEEYKHPMPHEGRKHGGKVHGKEPKGRPDRRARGGATADLNPETAAGRVSVPDYQRQHELRNRAGHGKDTQGPTALKGHRHPN